jgi:hypothetical protein
MRWSTGHGPADEVSLRAPRTAGFFFAAGSAKALIAGGEMTRKVPKRILLKLSGEALLGGVDYGIDPAVINRIASELRDVRELGIQVASSSAAATSFRGAGLAQGGMDRVTGDHMGMLGTVINSLATAGRAREARRARPGHVGDQDQRGLRGLHPAARDPPPGEEPRGHPRGRHRQPVLHDRHGRQPARHRDQRRPAAQGHQGQRRLFSPTRSASRMRSATRA